MQSIFSSESNIYIEVHLDIRITVQSYLRKIPYQLVFPRIYVRCLFCSNFLNILRSPWVHGQTKIFYSFWSGPESNWHTLETVCIFSVLSYRHFRTSFKNCSYTQSIPTVYEQNFIFNFYLFLKHN